MKKKNKINNDCDFIKFWFKPLSSDYKIKYEIYDIEFIESKFKFMTFEEFNEFYKLSKKK
jgi:hypothetical protein